MREPCSISELVRLLVIPRDILGEFISSVYRNHRKIISFSAQSFWLISRWILLYTWFAQNSLVTFLAIIAGKKVEGKIYKGQCAHCLFIFRLSDKACQIRNSGILLLWDENWVSSTWRVKILSIHTKFFSNTSPNSMSRHLRYTEMGSEGSPSTIWWELTQRGGP